MPLKKIIFTGMLAIIIVLVLIVVRQQGVIDSVKQNVPYLMKGERLPSFELNSSNGDFVDNAVLRNSPHSLIFIFQRPCTICDKNLPYWQKLKKLIGKRMPVYGIVLDDHKEMARFADKINLNFEIFAPVELPEFIQEFRINMNMAQTILISSDRVDNVWIGALSGDNFKYIVDRIKLLLKGV